MALDAKSLYLMYQKLTLILTAYGLKDLFLTELNPGWPGNFF
jgi:hypothetical protein